MTITRRDPETGLTYYFTPVLDENRRPPSWACTVRTSAGAGHHQVGPLVCLGRDETDRELEHHRRMVALPETYGLPIRQEES